MRKDLFIVGSRLLGIWLLLGVISPVSYIVVTVFVPSKTPTIVQITNITNALLHVVFGLFLLVKTNSIYGYLHRILDEKESMEDI